MTTVTLTHKFNFDGETYSTRENKEKNLKCSCCAEKKVHTFKSIGCRPDKVNYFWEVYREYQCNDCGTVKVNKTLNYGMDVVIEGRIFNLRLGGKVLEFIFNGKDKFAETITHENFKAAIKG